MYGNKVVSPSSFNLTELRRCELRMRLHTWSHSTQVNMNYVTSTVYILSPTSVATSKSATPPAEPAGDDRRFNSPPTGTKSPSFRRERRKWRKQKKKKEQQEQGPEQR